MAMAYMELPDDVIADFVNRGVLPEVAEEEMIEAGDIGMMTAMRTWDPKSGVKFADFAEMLIFRCGLNRFAELYVQPEVNQNLTYKNRKDAAAVAAWMQNEGEQNRLLSEVMAEIDIPVCDQGYLYVDWLIAILEPVAQTLQDGESLN